MATQTTRLPQLGREQINDERLLGVLDRAERLSTPKPAWYLTLAHSPEIANAYAEYWDLTHRGGQVEHTTKELMRIAIAQLLGCDFALTSDPSKRSTRGSTSGTPSPVRCPTSIIPILAPAPH